MTDLSPVDVFALILVIGALSVAGFMLEGYLRRVRTALDILRRHTDKMSAAVRQTARESLRLKRATALQVEREHQLTEDCGQIEQGIAAARRAASPLVVFDERKGIGDTLWQVPVSLAGREAGMPARPWRTFLVWAPTGEKAQQRVATRYSDMAGYLVRSAAARDDMPAAAE